MRCAIMVRDRQVGEDRGAEVAVQDAARATRRTGPGTAGRGRGSARMRSTSLGVAWSPAITAAGIARRDVEQAEHEQRHHRHDRDGRQDAPDDVAEHQLSNLGRLLTHDFLIGGPEGGRLEAQANSSSVAKRRGRATISARHRASALATCVRRRSALALPLAGLARVGASLRGWRSLLLSSVPSSGSSAISVRATTGPTRGRRRASSLSRQAGEPRTRGVDLGIDARPAPSPAR